MAKERLAALRQADPRAQLATALLTVSRDYGFSSWRALKAEFEQRQTKTAALFSSSSSLGNSKPRKPRLLASQGIFKGSSSSRISTTPSTARDSSGFAI